MDSFDLKVSRPVEDVCNLCYIFFSDHQDIVDELARHTSQIVLDQPDCAMDQGVEEKEQMTLKASRAHKNGQLGHLKAQQKFYQDKVEKANKSVDKCHSEQTYTFVINWGRIWSCPYLTNNSLAAHATQVPCQSKTLA